MSDIPPIPGGARPRVPFWQGLFSGKDNASPAIGRVLAFATVVVVLAFLLVGLPAVIVLSDWLQHVRPGEWQALLGSLTGYVPTVVGALGGAVTMMVRVTAPTEPDPERR